MERERVNSQDVSQHISSNVGGQDKNGDGRRVLIKRSNVPIGVWFEEYSSRTGMPLRDLAKRICLSNMGVRGSFGLSSLSNILQKAPEALSLSDEETSTLAEAVAQTIEQRIAGGHNYSINSGVNVRKVQAGLDYPTFNGSQAAEILDTSRQHVFQLRQILGLPSPMDQEQFDRLKLRFELTREMRERRRRTVAEKNKSPIS